MFYKRIVMSLIGLVVLETAAINVVDVEYTSRWPWSRLVDVSYSLEGTDSAQFYLVSARAFWNGGPEDGVLITDYRTDPLVNGDGSHSMVIDAGRSLPNLKIDGTFRIQVTAKPFTQTSAGTKPDDVYLVIDLSSGSSSADYPRRWTLNGPDLNDDSCRLHDLWLKACPQGSTTIGRSTSVIAGNDGAMPLHDVVFTKPFWLGVFEVTQQQWYDVRGEWLGKFTNRFTRAMRPLDGPSMAGVRGRFDGDCAWPSSSPAVFNGSFIDCLQKRTGFNGADTATLRFDLPTGAQWEYACSAGTTTDLYWPDKTPAELGRIAPDGVSYGDQLATFTGDYNNEDFTEGTAKGGSYPANPWGFYDMYGNLSELTLEPGLTNKTDPKVNDYYASGSDEVKYDPEGAETLLATRQSRGGSWNFDKGYVKSWYCVTRTPFKPWHGVRLALFYPRSGSTDVPAADLDEASGASDPGGIDTTGGPYIVSPGDEIPYSAAWATVTNAVPGGTMVDIVTRRFYGVPVYTNETYLSAAQESGTWTVPAGLTRLTLFLRAKCGNDVVGETKPVTFLAAQASAASPAACAANTSTNGLQAAIDAGGTALLRYDTGWFADAARISVLDVRTTDDEVPTVSTNELASLAAPSVGDFRYTHRQSGYHTLILRAIDGNGDDAGDVLEAKYYVKTIRGMWMILR